MRSEVISCEILLLRSIGIDLRVQNGTVYAVHLMLIMSEYNDDELENTHNFSQRRGKLLTIGRRFFTVDGYITTSNASVSYMCT